jgi:hypothetical protein
VNEQADHDRHAQEEPRFAEPVDFTDDLDRWFEDAQSVVFGESRGSSRRRPPRNDEMFHRVLDAADRAGVDQLVLLSGDGVRRG